MYDIAEIASEEDILYGIRLYLAMDEQNGAENIEIGEVQTLSTEGQEIYYVLSSFESKGNVNKKCDAWVLLEDDYMLNCTIGQDDADIVKEAVENSG